MITIRFDSKFQIIAQLLDSIQNEKNTIRTSLIIDYVSMNYCLQNRFLNVIGNYYIKITM